MSVVVSAEEVWERVGDVLALPLPARQDLWEMARALQLVEGELVRSLDRCPVAAGQRQQAKQALAEMREALDWIDQYHSRVLRFEIAAVLWHAHDCIGVILAILRQASRWDQQAG